MQRDAVFAGDPRVAAEDLRASFDREYQRDDAPGEPMPWFRRWSTALLSAPPARPTRYAPIHNPRPYPQTMEAPNRKAFVYSQPTHETLTDKYLKPVPDPYRSGCGLGRRGYSGNQANQLFSATKLQDI